MNGTERIVEEMEVIVGIRVMEGVGKFTIRKDWSRWREWQRWRQWESEHHRRSWKHQERSLIEMDQMAEMEKKRACLGVAIPCLGI